MFQRTPFVVVVASLALAAACSSPKKSDASSGAQRSQAEREAEPARPRAPEKPWTTAFGAKAALVADEVTIEGPPGLLNHVVVQQSDEFFVHEQRATAEGLLLTTAVKPDAGGAPPIRVRLDAWTIDALVRVRVLERPIEAPVVVQLSGEAWYRELAGGSEQRSAVLRFVGDRP